MNSGFVNAFIFGVLIGALIAVILIVASSMIVDNDSNNQCAEKYDVYECQQIWVPVMKEKTK